MSDRSYIAMRAARREKPQACVYAAATQDPLFNESFPVPLPTPEKRKYVSVVPYRDHVIATYKDPLDEPLYYVAGVPIFAVYFALDELGGVIAPLDTCFWSPFLAMAFIDQYIAMNEHDRKAFWKSQGPWRMIHQNYNGQHQLPFLVDTLRQVAAEASDPDADLCYDDVSAFGRALEAKIVNAMDRVARVPFPSEDGKTPWAKPADWSS